MPPNFETGGRSSLNLIAMNESLLINLVQQQEKTEIVEELLEEERKERQSTETTLVNSAMLASAARMAAVLAHEINNPLAAVTNLLFLVSINPDLPDQVRQFLTIADGELKRIAHVTRQTLGFYKDQVRPEEFRVRFLLESACDMIKAKLESKNVRIVADCEESVFITAFRGELQQVVSNIVLNSVEAVADHGHVMLRASSCSMSHRRIPAVRITIADDGHGIDGADLMRIFDPFFTTKGLTGNGLGLWVSRRIIEQHGGSIHVRSSTKSARRGTTVSILLPQAM